jgi:kumamolisin
MQPPLPGAEPVGESDPDEQLTVTVYVRADPAAQFGADPADLSAVAEWGRGHGLSVVTQDPATRTLQLAGTVQAFSQAFGVYLQTWQYQGSQYRDRIGGLFVPESLAGVVTAVLGLDDRPVWRDTSGG